MFFFWCPVWFQVFSINCRSFDRLSDIIARAFNRPGATRNAVLDISKALDRFWHAGLIHKLKSYGIPGEVFGLALFRLISVTDSFKWFWMGSLHRNIHLMLEFLKVSFLVVHFSYYTLMTSLMLSVTLLSMLTILISTLSVIKHLICGNN